MPHPLSLLILALGILVLWTIIAGLMAEEDFPRSEPPPQTWGERKWWDR